MIVTSKDLDTISDNLCLAKDKVNKIIHNCKTVGDLLSIDLGLSNKVIEDRLKTSLVTLLYKLNKGRK